MTEASIRCSEVERKASRAGKAGLGVYLLVGFGPAASALFVTLSTLSTRPNATRLAAAQLTPFRPIVAAATAGLFGAAWLLSTKAIPVGLRRRVASPQPRSGDQDPLTFCYAMTLSLWALCAMPIVLGSGIMLLGRSPIDLLLTIAASLIMAAVLHPTRRTWSTWFRAAGIDLQEA